MVLLKTISSFTLFWCITFFAALGWTGPLFIKLTFAFILLIILISMINYEGLEQLSFTYKAAMIGLFFLTALLFSAMMYLSWNLVGSNIIKGIQGRYFIPISPLVFLSLGFISVGGDSSPLKNRFIQFSRVCLIVFPILSAVITIIGILDRYY